MTYVEIIHALKNGKKIRNTSWTEDEYIYYENYELRDEKNEIVGVETFFEASENSWEIYNDTITIKELAGCIIKVSGIDYYVVPQPIMRSCLTGNVSEEYVLLPLKVTRDIFLNSHPANTRYPKSCIVKFAEEKENIEYV